MKNLEAKMDQAFQESILFPREQTVIDFLVSVLNNPEKFREDGRKIEVIGLYYYAASPLSFLFADRRSHHRRIQTIGTESGPFRNRKNA